MVPVQKKTIAGGKAHQKLMARPVAIINPNMPV